MHCLAVLVVFGCFSSNTWQKCLAAIIIILANTRLLIISFPLSAFMFLYLSLGVNKNFYKKILTARTSLFNIGLSKGKNMTQKMTIWESLEKTDPKYTKPFKRPGGFSGTSINPTYAIKRMTEIFGVCGVAWGVYKPEFQLVELKTGEIMVYCTLSVWITTENGSSTLYGVGGDRVASIGKNGMSGDDEAFKKAYTDAVINALKFIGNAADLHLGMYDDSKYVNDLRQHFAEDPTDEFNEIISLLEKGTPREDLRPRVTKIWALLSKEQQNRLAAK